MPENNSSVNVAPPAVTTSNESSLVTIGIISLIRRHHARQEYNFCRYYKRKYYKFVFILRMIFVSVCGMWFDAKNIHSGKYHHSECLFLINNATIANIPPWRMRLRRALCIYERYHDDRNASYTNVATVFRFFPQSLY